LGAISTKGRIDASFVNSIYYGHKLICDIVIIIDLISFSMERNQTRFFF